MLIELKDQPNRNYVETVVERLKKYNPAIITGETKDRVAEQDKFMNDEIRNELKER